MTKNRYVVYGIRRDGLKFKGTCIAYDIISAINLFREAGYSVHTVPERKQVNANSVIKIEEVFIVK